MNASALILTLNEEINLPRCLESLAWCDDIVVLDSYSNDRTESIAKEHGARVIHRKFDDYATQRNFGINETDYKNQWVLMVDADEVVTDELKREIEIILDKGQSEICLYRLRIKYYFMGKWIRYSSGYPTWYGRLIKRKKAWIERSINEHCHTEGAIGYLDEHLLHYPFNKGFHNWFEKHNRYSNMEAQTIFAGWPRKIIQKDLFSSDPVQRRKAIKEIVYSLPGRPFLIFLALFILRRGFLDGKAGVTYCLLRAIYEYMIDCKVKEMKIRSQGKPL